MSGVLWAFTLAKKLFDIKITLFLNRRLKIKNENYRYLIISFETPLISFWTWITILNKDTFLCQNMIWCKCSRFKIIELQKYPLKLCCKQYYQQVLERIMRSDNEKQERVKCIITYFNCSLKITYCKLLKIQD